MNENESIFDYLKTNPDGSIKFYRGHGSGSENDIHQFIKNKDELHNRLIHAMKYDCYIEVISISLQVIDFWLRIYFLNKDFVNKRGREFGHLLNQCKELGLGEALYEDLKKFNQVRIYSIHGYVIGRINYASLFDTAINSMVLSSRVAIFVLENCGIVITDVSDLNFNSYGVGDMLLNVHESIVYYKQFLKE